MGGPLLNLRRNDLAEVGFSGQIRARPHRVWFLLAHGRLSSRIGAEVNPKIPLPPHVSFAFLPGSTVLDMVVYFGV